MKYRTRTPGGKFQGRASEGHCYTTGSTLNREEKKRSGEGAAASQGKGRNDSGRAFPSETPTWQLVSSLICPSAARFVQPPRAKPARELRLQQQGERGPFDRLIFIDNVNSRKLQQHLHGNPFYRLQKAPGSGNGI